MGGVLGAERRGGDSGRGPAVVEERQHEQCEYEAGDERGVGAVCCKLAWEGKYHF